MCSEGSQMFFGTTVVCQPLRLEVHKLGPDVSGIEESMGSKWVITCINWI